MILYVDFDDEITLEYYHRNSPINFGLYWEHKGDFYPLKKCYDFGLTILNWWLIDIERAFNDKSYHYRFSFMDGPHEMFIAQDKSKLIVRVNDENYFWVTDFCEMIFSMDKVIKLITKKMVELELQPLRDYSQRINKSLYQVIHTSKQRLIC